jgi:coenzyme F420-0:L-glutamate ligase/coenzyme F420-1:gamma-L-glutamate ligase
MKPPPGALAILHEGRVAHLATVDLDCRPHVVAICYVFDGENLYSVIDPKPKRVPPERLRRVRNIRANPHVCLIVDRYDEDWTKLSYVQVHGRAEVLTGGDERRRAVGLLREKYPQYRQMPIDSVPVIKVIPERFVVWSAEGREFTFPGPPNQSGAASRG